MDRERVSLSLRLETFAGAEISRACKSAADIANRLGITVMFKFNTVDVMVCPGDDPSTTVEAWRIEMEREVPYYKLARGRALKLPESR